MIFIKKTFRWIIYALIAVLTLMLIAVGIVRFVIFPNINQYKNDIATTITKRIGLQTTVGHIATGWDGISPKMVISEIDIFDEDNQPALHLENVKGTLSWLSIPMLHPHLSNLGISNPKLTIHRKENGSIHVAGIPMAGEGKPDFANWLLSQAKININNAMIIWQDDLRQAPALSLDNVNLSVRNPAWRTVFGQHLFSLTAQPSIGTKQPIAVSGHFFGRDVSKMQTWHGEINLKTDDVDLTVWKPWFDYPLDLTSGSGKTDITLAFADTQIHKINADVAIKALSLKLNKARTPFKAKKLSGLLTWEKAQKTTTISGKRIELKTVNNVDIKDGAGFVSYTVKNNQPLVNASVQLAHIDLQALNTIQSIMKLPDNITQPLNALSPKGVLKDLSMSLQGDPQQPSHYQIKTAFEGLSINAYQKLPGFKNMRGTIDANEDNGTLQLSSKNAALDLKDILRWPIPAQSLDGKIAWNKNRDWLKITASNIHIANQHIQGTVNASYKMDGIKGGYLDLSGKFDRGNAEFAPFYYPNVMGEDTMQWLDNSIVSGTANNVQVTVKGRLGDFPFVNKQELPDPTLGIFKVSARIDDAVLEYGKSWPKIEALGLNMLFEGNSMTLLADKGNILGIDIVDAKAVIPKLNTHGAKAQVLSIEGKANGPVTAGVQFINESPVKQVTLGFTDNLKTAGHGALNIKLKLPLNNIAESTYEGQYTVQSGTMYANPDMGLPEMTQINGQLNFDGSGINAKAIRGQLLGGPMQFDLDTAADSTIHIKANGSATDDGIQQLVDNPLTASLSGNAQWRANIAIQKPFVNLDIQSDLQGLQVALPAPLGKAYAETAILRIKKQQTQATEDQIDVHYHDTLSAIILRKEKQNQLAIDRGDIAIHLPAEIPNKAGLALRAKVDYLNADDWLALNKNPSKESTTPPLLKHIDIAINKLAIFNRNLHALQIRSKASEHLKLTVNSQEMDGDIQWSEPNQTEVNGKIIARLNKLHIPKSNHAEEAIEPEDIQQLDKQYPALDIAAEDFKLGEKSLGKLALNAAEVNDDWVIKSLKISNDDSTLIADGRWHNWTRNPNTNLNFSLSSNDVGNTLDRFGYPDTMKGGVALISGQLQWPGSPHEFQKKGLNGTFRLGASKGQVLKIQPGVGRLLGLLTLQSLPRRLTLDFRDLFSEGFAFDEISGTAGIKNGLMHSDDFFMTGPAAETEIKGDIDLVAETQDLNVKVVPHISDTVSLAALAGGPIAGAAAFIAQKILKDPLNKIAQSEYVVTGTWDNPVEANAPTTKTHDAPSPLNAQ